MSAWKPTIHRNSSAVNTSPDLRPGRSKSTAAMPNNTHHEMTVCSVSGQWQHESSSALQARISECCHVANDTAATQQVHSAQPTTSPMCTHMPNLCLLFKLQQVFDSTCEEGIQQYSLCQLQIASALPLTEHPHMPPPLLQSCFPSKTQKLCHTPPHLVSSLTELHHAAPMMYSHDSGSAVTRHTYTTVLCPRVYATLFEILWKALHPVLHGLEAGCASIMTLSLGGRPCLRCACNKPTQQSVLVHDGGAGYTKWGCNMSCDAAMSPKVLSPDAPAGGLSFCHASETF